MDKLEKDLDVGLLHDKHVTQNQIDCLYCHSRIDHGRKKPAEKY